MDLGRLRQQLASPLTEVKSTESGKVDVVNIRVSGKMVKVLCASYKGPQDLLKFLDALDTDMIILNANLADPADLVSPVVMAKLIDHPEIVLVRAAPHPPPPRGGTSAPTARARRKGARRRHGEGQKEVPQAAARSESREAAARHPPPRPPTSPPAAGAPAPTPRGRGDGPPPPQRGAGV